LSYRVELEDMARRHQQEEQRIHKEILKVHEERLANSWKKDQLQGGGVFPFSRLY
jgi:hypothetical protein